MRKKEDKSVTLENLAEMLYGIGFLLVMVLVILISILLFGVKTHAINNPADQSSGYGQIPVEFYKVCMDAGGSRWLDFGFPMSSDKSSSIYFDNWISKDGDSKNFGVQVSKRFPKVVSFTFVNNLGFGNGGSSSSQEAWLDLRWKDGGVSVLLPFEPGAEATLGLRQKVGNTSLFLQDAVESGDLVYGISYFFPKKSVSLDLAYAESGKTSFVRISKDVLDKTGIFIPEIRIKSVDGTTYVGFGLAYIPK